MKSNASRIFDLLPAVYREQDETKHVLFALSEILGEQYAVLLESLEQLYDDQFIETCANWVVPYIGDLVGHRFVHDQVPGLPSGRAEVANTIAYRRRKGTATVLEQLARDVTGWPARVVEFFQQLSTSQYMNHPRPLNHLMPDLRRWESLERLDTAFNTVAHSIDVRTPGSGGRYNIPNLGIYLWRISSWSLDRAPAAAVDGQRFYFNTLSNDTPLYTRPVAEKDISHLAEPINVPVPISRRLLASALGRYYGPQKSLFVWVDDHPVDSQDISVCHLGDEGSGWAHEPAAGVAIDPELGRLYLAANLAGSEVRVRFHYGFSAAMAGGEYERAESFGGAPVPDVSIGGGDSIQAGLDGVQSGGTVEIQESDRYSEGLSIQADPEARIELRSANNNRAMLKLVGPMQVKGGDQAEVLLNGLVLADGPIVIPAADNELKRLIVRHCTLVPGRSLDADGNPQQPGHPSLIVEAPGVSVVVEDSIIGPVRAHKGAELTITDSIVDANDPRGVAYANLSGDGPGAPICLANATVIGKVHTCEMSLASNTIFAARLVNPDSWVAPVISQKKQQGCVRFCFVPVGSQVPRRFRCQPDLGLRQALKEAAERKAAPLSAAEKAEVAALIHGRLKPVFSSRNYGMPDYGQLSLACPGEIRHGADDESEMGVFHNLFHPQRETNLRVRLDEYLRFGLKAGIFYAS